MVGGGGRRLALLGAVIRRRRGDERRGETTASGDPVIGAMVKAYSIHQRGVAWRARGMRQAMGMLATLFQSKQSVFCGGG